MQTRYQVFVSSTYTDLKTERQEVIQALLEMDCIPAGMELFPAANDDQWSLIKEVIDDSDYYIVIVGGRYGSMTAEGISYTEKEYDYALEQEKPILGFVHGDPGSLPRRDTEVEAEAQRRFEEFREKVRLKPVKEYLTADQLGSVVSRGLQRQIRKQPGEGWVKGRFAASPQDREDVNELRARVAELELELERERQASTTPLEIIPREELSQGDEGFAVRYVPRLFLYTEYQDQPERMELYSWKQLLQLLGPMMWDRATETDVSSKLADDIKRYLTNTGQLSADASARIRIVPQTLDSIIIQFQALGYIRPSEYGAETSWTLSDLGHQELISLSAIRRSAQR